MFASWLGAWDWALLLVGLAAAWAWWDAGHLRRRGVRQAGGHLPLLGHMLRSLLQRDHVKDLVGRTYLAGQDDKYAGLKQFHKSILVIKDLELLKQITIKDFDHFQDHLTTIDEEIDPLFGKNLLSLQGQKWRDMRATLSPAFTGSKMRTMFDFVVDCSSQITDFFDKEMSKPENKKQGHVSVEMKDAFTRYANDVIATLAFGLKVDSLLERDNEFYTMGKKAMNFKGIQFLKIFMFIIAPGLMKMLKFRLFTAEVAGFFRQLVTSTVAERERCGLTRPDMLQLLMAVRKGTLQEQHDQSDEHDAGYATVQESAHSNHAPITEWDDDDITAQALFFFLAGFDTSSTLLCFMAHELAQHQEVQRQLQQEVDELWCRNSGKLRYADLQTLKYMDMVVSETLRMWPPLSSVDRRCTKTYTLPPASPGGKPYTVKKGESVWIPIHAFHHDPQYFPDPNTFNPERFSDENKASIQPFSFLPFGIGPRNCIGSRFALMEAKAVMFYLLAKFDFIITAKTKIPVEIEKGSFGLQSKDGFWLGLKPRDTTAREIG